jgi:hypothetical protein
VLLTTPGGSRVPFWWALLMKARFLLVDYTIEISNLDLVKDIEEIAEQLFENPNSLLGNL